MGGQVVIAAVVWSATLLQQSENWVHGLYKNLSDQVFNGQMTPGTAKLVVVGGTVLAAVVSLMVARIILLIVVPRIVSKTRTRWDDMLVKRGFFKRLARLVPATVVYLSAQLYTKPFFELIELDVVLQRLALIWIIIVSVQAVSALLNAAADIYDAIDTDRRNPISGFVGGFKLVVWIVGGILCLAAFTGKDPSVLVAGFGALTAVIMLIFKDSILGLVASFQIFANDLVRVGDWIEMPKHGVDGDVIAVTLTTIKVQNWDRTISTIPAYGVISESFRNWRGMQDSKGRRIKRSIVIDMGSVKFCTPSLISRFERFAMLGDYISQKQGEVASYNQEHGIDTSELINGRRLTNLGTFRAYLVQYLRRHPGINQDMTLMVRQREPSANGLPIEIYVFSRDKVWESYEQLQSDIFDHVLAVVGEFELRIFQNPSGSDMQQIGTRAA